MTAGNQRPPHINDKYAVSYTTYVNHGCRCDGCTTDHRERYKQWRHSLNPEQRKLINRRNSEAKERRYREQNNSMPAPNSGKPYSDADRAIALDRSLTVREAAQRLGRSMYSVRQFRSDNRE